MIGLCLGLAGVVWAVHPAFTLAWNHTIEKIRWEEDYRVTPDGLLLGEARVKGSGAGMEIPDDAGLRDGPGTTSARCLRCHSCAWGEPRGRGLPTVF